MDEACFTREGICNSHVWAEANPHAASAHCHQQCFVVNVWAGIVNDFDLALIVTLTVQCTDLPCFSGAKATRNAGRNPVVSQEKHVVPA